MRFVLNQAPQDYGSKYTLFCFRLCPPSPLKGGLSRFVSAPHPPKGGLISFCVCPPSPLKGGLSRFMSAPHPP